MIMIERGKSRQFTLPTLKCLPNPQCYSDSPSESFIASYLTYARMVTTFVCFFTYLIMICLIFVCRSMKYVYVCLVVPGQSVKTGFLTAYMESLGSTFSNGANFAVVGSSTLPKFVPFALNVQVMQFLHFKSRSNELLSAGNSPNCSFLFTHKFQLVLSIVNFNL